MNHKVLLFLTCLATACAHAPVQPLAADVSTNNPVPSMPFAELVAAKAKSNSKTVLNWNQFDSTAIVRTTRGKNTFICSAVLLRRDLALTTAHCVANSDKNEILLGKSLTDPLLRSYLVDTKRIKVHPDYHPETSLFHADLAVLPLLESVPLTSFISIPELESIHLQTKQALERVGFGLRNLQNLRTWTEVFFERQAEQVLYLQDALSVTGDSGSAIFLRNEDKLQLIALHTTLLEPGKVAAVSLPAYKAWIFTLSQTH